LQGEVLEEKRVGETTLNPPLPPGINLWVHGDDCPGERLLCDDSLCCPARSFVALVPVFHYGIQLCELSPLDGMPQPLPDFWFDRHDHDLDHPLRAAVPFPKTYDQGEPFSDIELPQRIAEADAGSPLRCFDGNRAAVGNWVRLRRQVPFARVLIIRNLTTG